MIPHRQLPARRHRAARVDHQFRERFRESLCIAEDLQRRTVLPHHPDGGGRERPFVAGERFFEKRAKIDRRLRRLDAVTGILQLLDDLSDPQRLTLDALQLLAPGRFRRFLEQQELRLTEQSGEGIVHLVGDARAELTHGGELLRAQKQILRFARLARLFLHPVGELAVPALDLRCHGVECARQIAELVAATGVSNAVAELPAGQRGCAAMQGLDRPHDGATGKKSQGHSRRERDGHGRGRAAGEDA